MSRRDGTLSRIAREIRDDLAAAQARDPAAKGVGRVQILLTYPGVHALLAHRVAHALHNARVPLLPLAIAYLSRSVTGIEIHPAARIGRGLLIDHGSGVVVGETAEIGDRVTLYQGVTLGGTGFARGKRHPTVEDDVVVGSGAKLLGPIRVGRAAKVGANSVVIHDVPANSTVVGNPGHPVRVEGARPDTPDADWLHLPDPVADAISSLSRRVAELEAALEEATGRKPESGGAVTPLRRARGQDPAAG
jgi:serine O-acetyltransferase